MFFLLRRASIAATTEHGEDIVYADIDMAHVEEIRSSIPTRHQKRWDVYTQVKDA